MKICVSAMKPSSAAALAEAAVDPRFGRAAAFCIYDTETGEMEMVAGETPPGGAGVQAAQMMVDRGVQAVLTGAVGPNAFRVLAAAGISVYAKVGKTVDEAIAAYQAGELTPVSAPTNAGHIG